jgi:serine/threonine-protein kinase
MAIAGALWLRVWPLLNSALAQDADRRAAWVAGLEVEADVREALERLLADREAIEREGFLDGGPRLGMQDVPADDPADALGPGALVGTWRLLEQIGQGGMGVVWKAERGDGAMRRRVALKIPHAGPGQALLAERLRRECGFLSALDHPNIARLYDVGVTPQGLPFLVLELVEGESLADWCNARRLPVAKRLRLFLQVLRAVQHAHSALVLHRDIKPSNILVCGEGEGEVKLLDFGIAKVLRAEGAEASALTRHHGRMLTPDYAAPEQIAGGPVGTPCDLYALGVVLFELLTGERPYRLPRASAGALEEAILRSEPRRPSEAWRDASRAADFGATPARLRRALRGDLDLIVLKALRKLPERRYATAEAFAQDIERHLATEPVLAQPDSRWYRLRKFVARNAMAVATAAAMALSLGGGLGAALWQARQTRLEAEKANAIKDFLVGLFESNSVEQDDAPRRRQQSVQSLLEQSARALGSGLAGQPQVRDELEGVVGRLLHELALNDSAIELRTQRVQLLASNGASPAAQVGALVELSASLAQRGDAAQASEVLERALAACAPLGDEPPLVCLSARLERGLRAERAHDLPAAHADIEPAAAALLRRAPGSAEAADALAALGELTGTENHTDEATLLYQRAMAIREGLWGPRSLRLARERFLLANNFWADRHFALAEKELRSALATFDAALGHDHVSTALVELHLGRLLSWLRGEGGPEVRHATDVIRRHASDIAPDSAFDAALVAAETLLLDGRIAEAGPAFDEARALPHSAGEITDNGDRMLAWYLQSLGRYDTARDVLGALRARLLKDFGPTHPYVADIDDRLAGVDAAQGRLDQAQQGYERVLHSQDAREESFGSMKHDAQLGLALVDMERGRFDRAWPVISANYAAAAKTPREEQYRATWCRINDQMGRVLTGLGRAAEARPHFERALLAMAGGYAQSPDLALLRAHYALALLGTGETALARQQVQLAEAALKAEPGAAPHFARAVGKARAALDRTSEPTS